MYSLAKQGLSGNTITACKSFKGVNTGREECWVAVKRRLGFRSPLYLFLFNPVGIENLIVLLHSDRNFLAKRVADLFFFLEGGAYYLGTC